MTSSNGCTTTLLSHCINLELGLGNLNRSLANATVEINFLGSRLIQSEGSFDSIDLDILSGRIGNYVNAHKDRLSEMECREGLSCIQKMREFYKVSDEMIGSSNFFTRVLVLFRELVMLFFDDRKRSIQARAYDSHEGGYPVVHLADATSICSDNIEYKLKKKIYDIQRDNQSSSESVTRGTVLSSIPGMPSFDRSIPATIGGISSAPIKSDFQLRREQNKRDVEQLGIFCSSLTAPASTDDEIRVKFFDLPQRVQEEIKKHMWEFTGGVVNPNFAAGQSDWAGDQIRANPIPRRLLTEAASLVLVFIPLW